jgi:hypothetical protein
MEDSSFDYASCTTSRSMELCRNCIIIPDRNSNVMSHVLFCTDLAMNNDNNANKDQSQKFDLPYQVPSLKFSAMAVHGLYDFVCISKVICHIFFDFMMMTFELN